jgi:hypothetical protein
MGHITIYGYGASQYDFTNTAVHQERISSNFSNLVRTSQRMVMTSGGFDRYGVSKAPNEVGTVTLQLTLKSSTRNGMETLRDSLRAITRYGLVPLVYQPTNPSETDRFCYARITSISMPQSPSQHTDLHQQVTINWEAPDPIWHTTDHIGDLLGVNFLLGTSVLGGTPATINASGTSTDATITNDGNAPVLAQITVTTGASQTCQNPTIRRIVGGSTVDEVSYTATLGNSKVLIIDGIAKTVTLDGVNSFNGNFDFTHPAWMRLMPGDNTIRVVFANSGDAATVKVAYFEDYYGA